MRRKRRWVSLLLAMGLLAAPAAAEEKPYITQVAAGRPATLAVLSNGDVYAWGNNSLGLIDRSSRDGDFGWNAVLTPTKILTGVKRVAVPHEAGFVNNGNMMDNASSHTGKFILYVKENGELWGKKRGAPSADSAPLSYPESISYTRARACRALSLTITS